MLPLRKGMCMHRFARYKDKGFGLPFSLFIVGMAIFAATKMFPFDLGDGPVWSKIFVLVFIAFWYGLLAVFFLYGLSTVQDVEIDSREIRVCMGKFVVRRIPLETVKTVGMSVEYASKGNRITNWMLVLSEKDRYELDEKGQKYLKRRGVGKRMAMAGVPAEEPYGAARAFLFESRKGELLRTEWSEGKEAILRQYLPASAFLL